MASLKETKNRIASVGNTLKITSAMKLVASSKLRRAQQAIGNMLPYERQLNSILVDLMMASSSGAPGGYSSGSLRFAPYPGKRSPEEYPPGGSAAVPTVPELVEGIEGGEGSVVRQAHQPDGHVRRVAIVAFASNSSLCGAFNANAVKMVLSVINEYRSAGLADSDITVYSVGRKMQDSMRRAGFPSPADYSKMAESPSYSAASALAQELLDGFVGGRFDKVELVHNHFKSTASQPTVRETYLPMGKVLGEESYPGKRSPEELSSPDGDSSAPSTPSTSSGAVVGGELRRTTGTVEDLIIEPSPEELLEELLPKVIRLRIYTTLLDSNAAEHAARTVAMQTATDNGNNLLQELTLEYNKGRQQKITSEILDIVGGSLQ